MTYNKRNGKYFIAYQGTDLSRRDITLAIKKENTFADFVIKEEPMTNGLFCKIVLSRYSEDRDPYKDTKDNYYVSAYNQEELESVMNENNYDISDQDKYHLVIPFLYRDFNIEMFKKLKRTHTCTVILNKNNEMIAGVTNPDGSYTHLYYGYTTPNNEIVYSNSMEVLKELCHDIKEMPPLTYMKNGKLFDFNHQEINQNNSQLIKNTKENADSLILGLNKLLVQITNESVKEKIEENINDYLKSDDPKKRITDYITKELDNETQKEILNLIKTIVQNNNIENMIDSEIHKKFDEKYNEYSQKIQLPMVHIIKLNDTVLGQTQGSFYHEKFEEILTQVQLEEPVMLIGPAGSGKNVIVKQVADALGLHMYYTNNASNEFKLTGFIDAGGNYRETEFYKAFKNGGLFNLDEIDASDPSALIVINSALANGYMAFPHETIDRHKDFKIVTEANTWGKGSDLEYVGRNPLDGSTLDRFDNIFINYDRNLEKNLYPNNEVLEFMWSFRDAVEKSKIHHIVSTRGIGKVFKKYTNNLPIEQILRTNVIRNLGQDDLNTIIGNMTNISGNNKFYNSVKTLRLK